VRDRDLVLERRPIGEVLDDRRHGLVTLLEAREPGVDSSPSRAHEIDEEREVVHARVPFGEQLAFESLEPPSLDRYNNRVK
jgi:hypothetical protein